MNSNFNYLLQQIETLQNLIASNSVTSNTPSLITTGSSGTFLGSSDGDNWFVWKSEGSGIDYSSSSFEANGKFFNSSQFYTTDFKNFLKVESFNIPKPETSSNTSYWGNLGYRGGKYYYWISNGRELYESLDLVNWTFLNLDTNNQWYSKVIFEGELIFSISSNNGRYSYTKINDTSQSTEIHISEICCSRIIDIEFFNGNYYLISSKRLTFQVMKENVLLYLNLVMELIGQKTIILFIL
ncbi:MAG: hypothetical protein ACJ0DI_05060 [bacterium]